MNEWMNSIACAIIHFILKGFVIIKDVCDFVHDTLFLMKWFGACKSSFLLLLLITSISLFSFDFESKCCLRFFFSCYLCLALHLFSPLFLLCPLTCSALMFCTCAQVFPPSLYSRHLNVFLYDCHVLLCTLVLMFYQLVVKIVD